LAQGFALGFAAQTASAQGVPSELVCTFDQGVARDSESRSTRQERDDLVLTFSNIDLDLGRATIAGPQGSGGVALVAASHVMTFVEVAPNGAVATTSVSRLESDQLVAVHSRHLFDSITPRYFATQRYGRCVGR
jgi:hypothetical protein